MPVLLILAFAGYGPASSAETSFVSSQSVPLLPSESEEQEADKEEVDGYFQSVEIGIEADLELLYESHGPETAGEITFDEVVFTLNGEWWEAEAGIKYETEGDKGIVVEEVVLQIGGTEDLPWLVQVGRLVLPFGEYDSQFIEDPLALILGEIDDETIVLGFETDRLRIAAGAFRGEHNGDGDLDGAASVNLEVIEGLEAGISWTSDLGESVEMREWRQGFAAKYGLPAQPDESRVVGLAGSTSFEAGPSFGRLGYLTAVRPVAAGLLSAAGIQPSAWCLETGLFLAEKWRLAIRWEVAHELPEAPDKQYGLAFTHELLEQVTVTGEYLRGVFGGTFPDRDLVGLMVSFEF